jgi:hypothetical protein
MGLKQKNVYSISEIDEQIRKHLMENRKIVLNSLGNKDYPFGIFLQMFTYLKSINIKEISRIYEEKDYQRHRHESCSNFNVYSPDKLEKNLTTILENIQNVYSSIIKKNFPMLVKELPIFNGANLVVVIYNLPEMCPPMGPFPTWTIYYLKSDKSDDNTEIKIMDLKKLSGESLFFSLTSHKYLQYNGKNYTLLGRDYGPMESVYSDTPLFDLMYIFINRALNDFIKKNENDEFQY